MSDSDKAADGTDPERLLAEALRAQARSAPPADAPPLKEPVPQERVPQEPVPQERTPQESTPQERTPQESPSSSGQAPAAGLSTDPGPLPAALSGGPDPAPATERTTTLSAPPAEQGDQVPAGYGLLSGASAGSLERERAALDSAPAPARPAVRQGPGADPHLQQLSAWWVLGLALVLGLAAGSVVGLLTLL
jgi:hypothetical protein